MKGNGFGAILKAPFSKKKLHIAGFRVFDDTAILQTGLENDDYWEMTAKLKVAVNLWEKYTHVSGGCLVPAKSWLI